MGGNLIYSKNEYNVYRFSDGYIVHNTEKKFEDGHTHIKNFGTTQYLIRLLVKNKLPNDTTRYLIISLLRLSNDPVYIERAKNLLNHKSGKKQYYNVGGKSATSRKRSRRQY